ncbi:hypothetical protein VTO42DRAFT_7023 [Malbranchea cinnamomea]
MASKVSQYDRRRNTSPPRTPPQNSRYHSSRESRDGNNGHDGSTSLRPSFPETFLDDLTPGDNDQGEYESEEDRDPHDLSLSPQHAVRTSVVDNMLLSLDQLSEFNTALGSTGYDNDDDNDPYTLYSRWNASRSNRSRGHTFSSSASSNVDGHIVSPSGRFSEQPGRGRRSNSSSNFPGHSRATVNDGQRPTTRGDRSSQTQRTWPKRTDSRSSDSSVDFNQLLTETRMTQSRHNRRSASFDYGARPNPADILRTRQSSQDHDLLYHDIDAAPTPTVPAGPRKDTELGFACNRTPALSRRNSAKSSKSMHNKKARSDTLGATTIRKQADNNFEFFRDAVDDVPPVPAYTQPTAPSPTIPRHKSSFFHLMESSPPPSQPALPSASAQPKERQGFFRRVFGSSKGSGVAQPSKLTRDSHRSREVDASISTRMLNNALDNSGGTWSTPSKDLNKSSRDNTPVITKKPSSFFRRRKKSTADHAPPPLVLPHSNLNFPDALKGDHPRIEQLKPGEGNVPSPIGSLRNVMRPYLTDSFPAEPRVTSSGSNLDTKDTSNERNNSFLADSSDNEAPSTSHSDQKFRRPLTSPSSPNHTSERLFEKNRSTSRDLAVANNTFSNLSSSHAASPSLTTKSGLHEESSTSISGRNPDSLQPTRPTSSGTKPLHQSNWLEPASSTEQLDEPGKLTLPIEGAAAQSPCASGSPTSQYHTASNTPIVSSDGGGAGWKKPPARAATHDENDAPSNVIECEAGRSGEDISAADRELAQKLYEAGEEQLKEIEPTAAWLGAPDRAAVRKAYMEQFDLSNMNILAALRCLCSKLALKGETQQVDRVLDAFSTRWCECNPNHGFKATDVVHTICYSLLLLNTDLHLADIDHKMTRSQFIENTMPTIQRVAMDAAPESFESSQNSNNQQLLRVGNGAASTSVTSKRLSVFNDSNQHSGVASEVGPLVNAPFTGSAKAWEAQVESILKDFYNSIQKQRLPLRGAMQEGEESSQSTNILGITGHLLRRTPSSLSRGSDVIPPRGRPTDYRHTTGRWATKQRSRARLYPTSTMASSRTSLDDQSSIFSPTASSTWSKYSLGKTLTSVSVDSFGSEYPRGGYQQSIGFANALSHAIIREDSASVMSAMEDPDSAATLLEDETLELAGAPWAKEGNLKHKQHLDSVDKRSKDRNWNETFAVIQRGWMRLFNFNSSTKSMRAKTRQRQNNSGPVVVGGGNWTENAEETWKFLLRQTIATALPPPGYSKSRPHVWALSLPTGAVHLFQCGTPEIVKEFVTTANYWSARLSKEPLSGGVSNIEYGWSDAIINSALANVDEQKPASASGARPSLQSSIRSSIDQQGVRPRLPADRVYISDWTPPQQSMVASSLSESEQLQALRNYVKGVEEELQKHNDLREPMILAFSPKHPNLQKAMTNWERKSSYLLREIVKYRTYIDCLQAAQTQKEKIYAASASAETETEAKNDTLTEQAQDSEN